MPGKNTAPPMCKNCMEAHWREPGKVCPKFQTKKAVAQPKPKALPAPKKAKT